MFPQYAEATSGSTFTEVERVLELENFSPEIVKIDHYYNEEFYLKSLAKSITDSEEYKDSEFLLFSFHGLPVRHLKKSDHSQSHCQKVDKCCEKISENNVEKLKSIYFNFLDKQIEKKSNQKIYIDKFPLNIVHVGEILRIFPNAKFIIALRHPYDCVLSCFMQNFELNDAMANFLTIEDSAKLYDSVMSLWVKYLSIFKIKYHNVKYENLIKEFKPTVQSILNFLELPWDDSVLKYSRTAKQKSNIATPSYKQVIKPIYSYADGRWKRYENEMLNVNSILEKWVNKFDY